MSRQTIGENPFDTYVTSFEDISDKKPKQKQKKEKISINNTKKQRFTVQISEEVIENAKDAVYWTRGLTLAQLTEEALTKAIKDLEKQSIIYNDQTGKPLKNKGDKFPKRKEELRSGRPIS